MPRIFEGIGDTPNADNARLDMARQFFAMRLERESERMADSLSREWDKGDMAFRYYLLLLKGDLSFDRGNETLAVQYYRQAENLGFGLPSSCYGRSVIGYFNSGAVSKSDSLLARLHANLHSRVDSIVYYDVQKQISGSRGDFREAYRYLLLLDDIQNREFSRLLSQSASDVVMRYYWA